MDDGSRTRRPPQRRPLIGRGVLAFCVLVCLWPLLSCLPAASQPESGPTMRVDVGFGGVFVSERTTPVAIEIDHEGAPITGELIVRQTWRPLMEAPRTVEARRSVTLGPKAQLRYVVYLPLSAEPPPGGDDPALNVTLRAGGRTLAEQTVTLEGAQRGDGLVLMASESGYLQELPTGEMTIQRSADDLPTDWRGYGGVRRLYVGRLDAARLEPEQRSAVRKWVTSGGELVVLSGENAFHQDAEWLNALVPFEVTSVETIEAFGARAALGTPRGEVRYAEADRPLLTQWQIGRGQVSFSALALLNSGPTQAEVWSRLTPGRTERSGAFTLGAELFRRMSLRYPNKMIVGGIFGGYMLGIGLLMLWGLRRTPWTSGGRAGGLVDSTRGADEDSTSGGRNRLWVGMVLWIGLVTAIGIGYGGQSAFNARMQSLEVGVIWGSARAELMDVRTGFATIAKRRLDPSWTLPSQTSVFPLNGTDLRLDDGGATLRPLGQTLPPNVVQDLALETVMPLDVNVDPRGAMDDASEGEDVSVAELHVYNGSRFRLAEPVIWQRGAYRALPSASIMPGQRETIDVESLGPAAAAWVPSTAPPSGFTPHVKGTVLEDVDRRLRGRNAPWALLAWVRAPGLSVHADEYRETWRLLVVTP